MAAAGGHWVKGSTGPYAGKMNFVPKTEAGNITVNGTQYVAIKKGSVMAGQLASGDWQVTYQTPDGKFHPVYNKDGSPAIFKNQAAAEAKMANMHGQGATKALHSPNHKDEMQGIGMSTTAKKPATGVSPGAKVATKKAEPVTTSTEKPVTTPKPTTGTATNANTGAALNTKADFDANATDVTITTLMGKPEVVKGVLVENGALGVTYNTKTGQYHVVDAVSGKTIGKYDTAEAAFSGAKAEVKNMVSVAPPPSKIQPFASGEAGHKAMIAGYKDLPDKLTYSESSVISSYQDSGYGPLNKALWHNQEHSATIPLDSAMSKAKLPQDAFLVRSQGNDHPLYHMAKALEVGGIYHAKGYDSTSVNPYNSWGGGAVKLQYRAPKGIPAVYVNKVTGGLKNEYEVLLGRNMNWKVVGKTVHQGNITLTLEYLGLGDM